MTKKKSCSSCKKEKKLTEFYKNKSDLYGYNSVCKECKIIKESVWRDSNRETRKDKQRNYYEKNKERIKESRIKNYDPLKTRARYLARKIKVQKCEFCENEGERHHEDYTKPLDIVFLCKSHHKQVHDGSIKLKAKLHR